MTTSILDTGVFRFDLSQEARNRAFPSLSFEVPQSREVSLPGNEQPSFVPEFSVEEKFQIVTLEFPEGTSFYGTGEVSGSLERSGKRIFTYNSDAWAYGKTTTCLYQSHPWVFVVLPGGEALGVLADTTRKCEVDLRTSQTLKFVSESFYPVITFGPYASPEEVLIVLSKAIGRINMPPKWALGYHQCRYSYEPAARVEEIARTFREKQLPCDVIWMDIDYMDGYRCFTFDPEKFPDPTGLATQLRAEGFKAIWMLDPGIKHEKGYFVYDSGFKENAFVVGADGEHFIGDVWPGPCVFPDFTQARVRTWWSKLVKEFVHVGVDGIWNDMNEPTVFKSVLKTMPGDYLHNGDAELGGHQPHLHYHNVYGMLMARSTHEGMLLYDETKRPFVLTRAGFIGSQRYAATWTGDNISNWDHAHMSISMVLNLGLSGQPFSGPDIGGFVGDATARLFGRWMGFGALFPFSRGHSEKGTIDHEPWSFGEECENVCRLALRRRYRLLPHFYTLFYNAHMKGIPVASPVFFADSKDQKLRELDSSFLLGALLVSASADPNNVVSSERLTIPKGIWQRFDFDDYHPDLPWLHLKGGSIIPAGPLHQNVGEAKPDDPLTLIVALDEEGCAAGMLYEDGGDGFDYQKGTFLLTYYEAKLQEGNELVVNAVRTEGSLKRPRRALQIRLLIGDCAETKADGWDGEPVILRLPTSSEMIQLVEAARRKLEEQKSQVKGLAEFELKHDELKGVGAPKIPVDLSGSEFTLKVVPWIGGRIVSMVHKSTGIDLLQSRLEMGGYEEYSSVEDRGPGCTEEYDVISRNVLEINGEDVLLMEAEIGGGLAMRREIAIRKNSAKVCKISSEIYAKAVGAGAGGYSRIACLRVNPTFQVPHPTETTIEYKAVDGSLVEHAASFGETILQGDSRPNGEWMLIDKAGGYGLINRFNVDEISTCVIHWGGALCNLELRSQERPVSRDSSLRISHEYEIINI